MNGSDEDIQWLSDQRPSLPESDVDASIRSRADLMALRLGRRGSRRWWPLSAANSTRAVASACSRGPAGRPRWPLSRGRGGGRRDRHAGRLDPCEPQLDARPELANADIMSLANTVSARQRLVTRRSSFITTS